MDNNYTAIKKGGCNPLKMSEEYPELYYHAIVRGKKDQWSYLQSFQEAQGSPGKITDFFAAANHADISIELEKLENGIIEFFQTNYQKRIMSSEEITLLPRWSQA